MNMFSKCLLLAASAGIASVARAEASSTPLAELAWSARTIAGGRIMLTGVNRETGQPFDLKVSRNGFVSGRISGRQVRYWVAPEQHAKLLRASAAYAASSSPAKPTS